MKSLIAIFSCLVLMSAGSATAGGWFDDFEGASLHADWTAADAKANGVLDTAQDHTDPPGKSLRIEQTPTETRPTRDLKDDDGNPTTGALTVWFFDDGADIKAFDIQVSSGDDGTGVNKIAIGLRDATIGSGTNYTFTANGSTISTGVARSTGWHKAEFSVHTTGALARLDSKTWPGHHLTAMTLLRSLTFYTNLGTLADANHVWIDDVNFSLHGLLPGAADAQDWTTYE